MLSEERIILMTKMASYESNEGKKNMAIGKYFRSDYIGIQVMKSIVYGTIAFFIILALYIFYDFETFMQDLYKMDMIAFARDILVYYAVSVISYAIISYMVYSYRYAKAKKNLKCYYHNLKKLSAMYTEK